MTFPLLKPSEIESILTEMEISFTPNFLSKPDKSVSSDEVQSIFTALLEYFLGITSDELAQVPDGTPVPTIFADSPSSRLGSSYSLSNPL
ncbi:hypothetical protein GEMRC1_007893 [Eukaryota sp. GEM-RC1]